MEYILRRAMEINRLGVGQIDALQNKEKEIGRCLYSHEIQKKFGLPELKEVYLIPSDDARQSSHNQRIRGEMRNNNLIPPMRDFQMNEVAQVHEWDMKAKLLFDDLKVDFTFNDTKSNKKLSTSYFCFF
jgi:hypothetical protein